MISFNHFGTVNRDEQQAMLFYRDVLGLEMTREFTAPAEMLRQLFGISKDLKVLVFEKETLKFEVFIHPDFSLPEPNVSHAAVYVDDLPLFMKNASSLGVTTISGTHGGRTVNFIQDFSGNLLEIKQTM